MKPPESETKSTVNVFILHEDQRTGQRAKTTLDRLRRYLGTDWEFQVNMREFDELGNSSLADLAGEEAAEANLIILSARGRGELAPGVQAWLIHHLDHRDNQPRALAVLLDGAHAGRDPENKTLSWLRQFASTAHWEFFSRFDDSPRSELNLASQQNDERAHRTSTASEDIWRQRSSFPRGGINE